MKKLLALTLALVFILSLTACGSGNGALIGKWVSNYEVKQILDSKVDSAVKDINNRLLKLLYENLRASYNDLTIKENLQINNDGTYKLYFDTEEAKATMEKRIKEIVKKTIEEDEYGSRLGSDYIDSFSEETIKNFDFEKAFSNTIEGEYKIEGDKFYFDKNDTSWYGVFSVNGNKLSFSNVVGAKAENEQSTRIFTREFTKAG